MRLSFALLIAILITGCASSSKIQVVKGADTKLNKYPCVSVGVISGIDDSKNTLDDSFKDLLKDTITRKIFEKRLSQEVYLRSDSGTGCSGFQVNVIISDLHSVSPVARALLGAFAGQGKLVALVQFVDKEESRVLSEAKITGLTSSGSAFVGTTYESVERVAEAVADMLAGYF